MSTRLITADLHLSDRQRDEYRHQFVAKELPALVQRYKVDEILLLGDLTEEHDRHSARLVNRIVTHLHRLAQICRVIIVRGNHDAADEDWPFFRFARRIPGVSWINKPTHRGGDLFLPHTTDYKRHWLWTLQEQHNFIFAHATFAGAIGDNGMRLGGIPLEIFSATDRVIAGDIHRPQQVGQVTYTGAPYLVDFGDDYQPRVLIIDGDKVKSVPVPGPQKRLIELQWPDLPKGKAQPSDILKIRVRLTMKEVAHWWEIKQKLTRWANEHQYQIYSIHPIVDYSPQKRQADPQVKRSDEQLMQDYAKSRELDDKTLKVGLQLMEK